MVGGPGDSADTFKNIQYGSHDTARTAHMHPLEVRHTLKTNMLIAKQL